MKDKIILSMEEISERIKYTPLPEFDLVVGIATGGSIPASIVAYKTSRPLKMIKLNYRDIENNPIYEEPKLLSNVSEELSNKKVLLVDDVSVSGKTLDKAKSLLTESEVTTFVLKGNADIVIFPEADRCVKWPWNTE